MTEIQAAKRLGVTTSKVSDILRGKLHVFAVDELVRIALAAGLTVGHGSLTRFDTAKWVTSDEAISAFLADAENP
jgi:predicted XRE-type DNA-binding protein